MQPEPIHVIYNRRMVRIQAIIFAAMFVLFARLWYLQVTRADYYNERSDRNRLRTVETPPTRGMIYDRKKRPLVANEPSFNLVVRREFLKDESLLCSLIESRFGISRRDVNNRLNEYRGVPSVFPIRLRGQLSDRDIAFVESHRNIYPELDVEWKPNRSYQSGDLFSHIVGYTGEVTAEELNRQGFENVRGGDTVGKTGIEKEYNSLLMGRKGIQRALINSAGQVTKMLEEKKPDNDNNDLVLSVEIELQEAAAKAMEGRNGALVAIDPWTGEILAMVSRPSYNADIFSRGISAGDWNNLVSNTDKPLQNRAIQGTYAPGSVFKILVALAALGEQVITPETAFNCPGEVEMLGQLVHCTGTHGNMSLVMAITHSCNIYFYNVGLKLGVDRINKWATRLGMGRKTKVDLPSESEGLVPSSAWKMKTYHQQWYKGETIGVSIGQGAVSLTPLQVCYFMCAVATNKVPPQPQLRLIEPVAKQVESELLVSKEIHRLIVASMTNVVEFGTATSAHVDGIKVAGKTGTAQVINTQTAEKMTNYAKEFRENSWFACFAPAETPAVAVAVIIEHGGHGGTVAAPAAASFLRRFFELHPEKRAR